MTRQAMLHGPKYSILVAAFNVDATIGRCIDSIVAARQGHDAELIVLDDGSSDRTAEICAGYAQKLTWLRLISQPNSGITEVRNRLLREAKGRYLAFVDGDDAIEPGYFDVIDGYLRDPGIDMLVFGHNRMLSDGQIVHRQNLRADLAREDLARMQLRVAHNARIYMLCWARVFKRELAAGFVFDRRIRLGEDTAFNIYMMNRADRVLVVPDRLYNHFETPDSISSGAYKPALLDSFEEHYRARLRVHAWPQAGTADWTALKESIALTYVEHVLMYLLNNVRHLPLREQWGELRRIRDSVIYRQCIPDYAGRSPYRGVRYVVRNFIGKRYLKLLLGVWMGGFRTRLRAFIHPASQRGALAKRESAKRGGLNELSGTCD